MKLKPILLAACTEFAVVFGALALLSLAGCGGVSTPQTAHDANENDHKTDSGVLAAANEDADLRAERAKLSPEDQLLVAAQEFCVINSDEKLGSMGPPVKVMIKGQPVFLCCKGCQKKALANPDQTLAKVEEIKAKVKVGAAK